MTPVSTGRVDHPCIARYTLPVFTACGHGSVYRALLLHAFADDSQIYGFCRSLWGLSAYKTEYLLASMTFFMGNG